MELKLPMILCAASILTAGLSWQSRWLHLGRRTCRNWPLLPPQVRRGIHKLGTRFFPSATSPDTVPGVPVCPVSASLSLALGGIVFPVLSLWVSWLPLDTS